MNERRFWGAVLVSAACWSTAVVATIVSSPQGQQPPVRRGGPDMSEFLPPGSGKELVARECTACHDLEGVIRLRETKQGWEAVVLDMVARGAPLMIEDADAITGYLSTVFGPKAPPFVDVNSATRDELLKLPGVTPEMADRLLAHRKSKGPIASRDELRTLLGIDAAEFEKLKYFVRARKSD